MKIGREIKREGEKRIWRERGMEIRKKKKIACWLLFLFFKKCCYREHISELIYNMLHK